MKVKEILKDGSIWIPNERKRSIQPIVSILCPTYSRAKNGLFPRAVQTVLKQELENFELIIIDDCSVDGSFDLTKQFMKQDSRVHCIRHTHNVGLPAISLYEGYMKARGEYIAFLFDDNEWESDFLSKTISYMSRKGIKASYGIYRLHDLNDEVYIFSEKNDCVSRLAVTNTIANGSVVLHKEVLETVGLYDPHLTLTRLCDWDLWRRVSRKYPLEATHIIAGNEWGATQQDSLGNSLKMNSWCAFERMNLDRDEMLKPQNYLECDIDYIPLRSSRLFRQYIVELYEQYKKKTWYKEPAEISAAEEENIKYIAVIAHEINATTYLTFERLNQSPDFVVRIFENNAFPLDELVYADVAISVRMLYGMETYEKICVAFKIPLYYYVDDNFPELKFTNENDTAICYNAERTTATELIRYDGILLSCDALTDYFRRKCLHQNLITIKPIMGEILRSSEENQSKDMFTVAFMGGVFREEVFYTIVVPALLKLSAQRPIRVIAPEPSNNRFKLRKQVLDQLNWEYLPRNQSLELYLHQINQYHVDVITHCGSAWENNKYKTENMLLNATQIGAVLVSSKNGQDFSGPIKLSAAFHVKNEPNSWYRILSKLASDDQMRQDAWEKAREYCQEIYSKKNALNVIKQIAEKCQPLSFANYLSRYNALYFDLFYHMNCFSGSYDGGMGKPSRDAAEAPLVLSQLIKSKISYKIHCNEHVWSEIGICFGCYGSAIGTVKLTIQQNGQDLRSVLKKLKDIDITKWNYFCFDPIIQTGDNVYTILFEFDYQDNSSLVGIFEDSRNRTFMYKVLNKLGCHRPGMDALFADCR